MLTPKPSNTRGSRVGLSVGSFAELLLCGLLLLCGSYPPPRQFLETAFPYSAFGYYVGDLSRLLGLVCGGLTIPTVFTFLVKQRYFVWVLGPVILLVSGIITSSLAAESTIALRDDFLPLLIAALLCGLTALFRHWLRRLFTAPPVVKPQVKWLVIITSLVPVVALVLLGWRNFTHPVQTSVTLRTYWPASKEVTLPLVEYGSLLYVQAELNGQNVLCEVDTGAESVEWPRGLHVGGVRTRWSGQNGDLLGNWTTIQTVFLSSVRIGGYDIKNLPTEMSDKSAKLFSLQPGPGDDAPTLGNPAFVQTILTIDRKNLLLTLRPPEYDFAKQQRKPGDRILDMGWTSQYPAKNWRRGYYGTPSIQAVINGFPFWCTLDTGAGGPEICLTRKLVEEHLSLKQAERGSARLNGAYSSAQVPHLDNLNIFLPCTTPPHAKPLLLKLNGLVTPTLKTDAPEGEGVIGLPLMERYRITIDYGRGRILLEPYKRDVPRRKQEKRR